MKQALIDRLGKLPKDVSDNAIAQVREAYNGAKDRLFWRLEPFVEELSVDEFKELLDRIAEARFMVVVGNDPLFWEEQVRINEQALNHAIDEKRIELHSEARSWFMTTISTTLDTLGPIIASTAEQTLKLALVGAL